MTFETLRHGATSMALATAALFAAGGPGMTHPAAAATVNRAAQTVILSTGRGQMVRLDAPMADLFVADPKIADVQVRSPTQLYIFGKGDGETSVFATGKGGGIIWSATVRVGTNLDNVGAMLGMAMPEADLTATPMNGMILLTGAQRDRLLVNGRQRDQDQPERGARAVFRQRRVNDHPAGGKTAVSGRGV